MKNKKINLLIILLCSIQSLMFAQFTKVKEYAENNCITIDQLELKKPDNSCRLFSVGELYGKEANVKITIELIRYFHDKENIRYIYISEGYSKSLLYNLYLKNGSKKLYDFLLYYNGKVTMEKLDSIREFNILLPENKRVKFIGVDFEPIQTYPQIFFYLKYITPQKGKTPQEIEKIINSIRDYNDVDKKPMYEIIDNFMDDFNKNYTSYKTVYKDNIEDISHLVKNLLISKSIRNYPLRDENDLEFNRKREAILYENMKTFLDSSINKTALFFTYPKRNSISGFLYPDKLQKTPSAISMLNNEQQSPVKGKVYLLNILYYKRCMFFNSSKKYISKKIYKIIRPDSNQICLLYLDKENSPFKEIANNKFQYIILANP